MAEVTLVGEEGTYKVDVDEDLTRYVEEGYLIQWVPGVYEFTDEGKAYFMARTLRGKGLL